MNSNFIKRVISALLLFPLLVLLIFKGPYTLLLFTIFLCLFIAWYEWKNLFDLSFFYFFYGFLLLSFSLAIINKFSPIFLFFFLFITSFLPQMFNFNRENFNKTFFPFLVGLIYFILGFGSLKLLIQSYSREILFFLFCIVFANDTGAYLVGKRWGQSPFFSEISPKKTWEGFFGGLFFALIVGFLLKSIFSLWPSLSLLTIVLMLSFCAVMGDLFESSIKRLTGKKDSGIIIPGHGGLLDRIDGVMFASPLYLFFLEVLNYGITYRLGL